LVAIETVLNGGRTNGMNIGDIVRDIPLERGKIDGDTGI
jgi:hypothetical protein